MSLRFTELSKQHRNPSVGVEKRPCVGVRTESSFRSRFSIYSLFRTTSGEFYNNNKDGKLWVNCRCVFKHGSAGKIDSQDVCSLRQALLSLRVNWLANSFRASPPWWSWIERRRKVMMCRDSMTSVESTNKNSARN